MLSNVRWWQQTRPEEIKPVPFLHPRVVEYLEMLVQPNWRILEHGSGGSTLWFAERCKQVIAFEQDDDWYSVIKKKSPENVTILSGQMQKSNLVPKLEMLKGFDLLLIDGEPVIDRARYIKLSIDLVTPGGVVVLDNANRPEYAKEREWMQNNCDHFETFDGNDEITKYMVTEFYFLKG